MATGICLKIDASHHGQWHGFWSSTWEFTVVLPIALGRPSCTCTYEVSEIVLPGCAI